MARFLPFVGLLAVGLVVASCGPPTAPEGDSGMAEDVTTLDARSGLCAGDDDCADDVFCNGRERCDPAAERADDRGCAPSRGRPCLDVQLCLEATDACQTDCGVDSDADDDGEDAAECGGTDCDDGDPLRFRANAEVCDDGTRDEDCDSSTFGARDLDRDGANDAQCCNVDAAGASICGDDCDDTRRNVRPLGTEVCDGLDNDCNDVVDEGVTTPAFRDVDGDLHGDPAAPTMTCPGAAQVSVVNDDCDDTERAVHGAQVEICDGLDNDCDERVDEHARPVTWYQDLDGDGFGTAASGTMVSCAPLDGFSLLATDCDDDSRSISPIASEICDGLDDDCNGAVDFRVGLNDFEDDDADGHADLACGGDDCEDGDWSAYLGAPEICDFRDSDCDGLSDQGSVPPAGVVADETVEIDWFSDTDQDSYGALAGAIRSCAPQAARVARDGDCADSDATRHPGARDRCNGTDDDCDGAVDEDVPDLAYYADGDEDGDGDGAPTLECVLPRDRTVLPGDCAPTDALRGPGTFETCNRIDDDCDGAVDEELFHDEDGDGHGDPTMPSGATCAPGDVGVGDDCNDLVSSLHPELAEACNLLDDDCDGRVDEAGAELCAFGSDHGMCIAGDCAYVCAAGTADCDGTAANGCETDLASDPLHCGDCATSCGVAGSCGGLGGCDDPIVQVSLGQHWHACARRERGEVMCWGYSLSLGNPERIADSATPVPAIVPPSAVEIATSNGATCARTATGEVWCWGWIARELAQPDTGGYVAHPVPGLGDAVELEGGHGLYCVRHATGAVSCWGSVATPGRTAFEPRARVPGVSDAVALFGSATTNDVFIRTADGRLLHFGVWRGVGGITDVTALFPSLPRDIVHEASSLGGTFGCALLEDGSTWCWGNNSEQALGDATTTTSTAPPRRITGTWDGAIEMAAVGGEVMCARFPDGAVRCSGDCATIGLRGDGCAVSPAIGTVVSGLSGTSPGDRDDAVDIAGSYYVGGSARVCVVRARGDLVCWGQRLLGSDGLGPSEVPVRAIID